MIYLYAKDWSTKTNFVVKCRISTKKKFQFVDRIIKLVYGNYLQVDKTVNCNQFTYKVNFYCVLCYKQLEICFQIDPLHSLIMQMDCIKIQYLVTFLCVAVYATTADQQNSSSFLSNYARQQDICRKMGWEPTSKNSN